MNAQVQAIRTRVTAHPRQAAAFALGIVLCICLIAFFARDILPEAATKPIAGLADGARNKVSGFMNFGEKPILKTKKRAAHSEVERLVEEIKTRQSVNLVDESDSDSDSD